MDDDGRLVARLRDGDDAAFAELVRRYHTRLIAVAQGTVGSRAIAEEVAQDTWLAVVRGVERFEGRSSFRTWLYHVLLNRARTAAGRERRAGRPEPDVAERFDAAGAWSTPPTPWADDVDDHVDAAGIAERVRALLPRLPDTQRQVVTLRDIERFEPTEVSAMLGISDGNQRVLLHRGRSRLRQLLAAEMGVAG